MEKEKDENMVPNQFQANVPSKVTAWSKVKGFLLQDVKVELTPKEAETFRAIDEFWHQEITDEQAHDFLFQKMKF